MSVQDIRLSPEFKRKSTLSILSIILFIFSYLFMVVLAVGLTVLCVYLAIMMVVSVTHWITIALGIGLASLGFLVLIFLLKFLFKWHKTDRSALVKVEEKDEPELFAMINEIVKEVNTDFPKHVFLSADVNASVFYDSSFWSMFLPVKKNLTIGLGLVNSASKEELKAVLAHEFGHFSQRSMKVGSYVYQVNQVIYNMLFDNESYDQLVIKFANVSGYFSIFVVLAAKIVQGIQWIFRKLYGIVNLNYMALSREMEFHADEIAARVVGPEPLQEILLRLEFSEYCLEGVLGFYSSRSDEHLKSTNIFEEQSHVMQFLSKENEYPSVNDLPKIAIEEHNKFNRSKLVIKDQWASHPSIEERIDGLNRFPRISNASQKLGNSLFKEPEKIQQRLTELLFSKVEYKETPQVISLDQFKTSFLDYYKENIFDKLFNYYYDNKNPISFDLDEVSANGEVSFDDLFSNDNLELVLENLALENDIDALNQIAQGVGIRSFDYDGKKYKSKEARKLAVELKKKMEALSDQIKTIDIRIYQFFSALESRNGSTGRLKELYLDYFNFDKEFERLQTKATELMNLTQFISQTTPFEEIERNFRNIKPLETDIKKEMRKFLENEFYSSEINSDIRETLEKYATEDLVYFRNEQYYDKSLEIFFTAMESFGFLVSRGYFIKKKELLDYKVELFRNVN